MDLRSRANRSRSKTPLTKVQSSEEKYEGIANHVEGTVIRTTRRSTVYKTNNSGYSSSGGYTTTREINPLKVHNVSVKSESSNQSFGYKTSDYSSEEGEYEISSLSENEKNKLIEDAKAAANGDSQVSALELYRRAGRYWDKYPKTDWTYSPHSRDRVELAPGVVQMPNMSRRTIHSYTPETHVHKETSTDFLYGDQVEYPKKRYTETYFATPTHLFYDSRMTSRWSFIRNSWNYIRSTVIWSTITTVFSYLYLCTFGLFYHAYHMEHSWGIQIGKRLHRLTSKVMLLDTWLLKKVQSVNRTRALLVFCLLPLLLLGGLHVLLVSGISLAPSCYPHCGKMVTTKFNAILNSSYQVFNGFTENLGS